MKQILLTGGLGYIGQKFQEKFQNKYVFHLIDTGYFKIPDLINKMKSSSSNIWIKAAKAMMTTDTIAKLSSKSFKIKKQKIF